MQFDHENTEVQTWFERDRAHVELRCSLSDRTILEFWDDDVRDLVRDGFLDPSDWHGSLLKYVEEHDIIVKGWRAEDV